MTNSHPASAQPLLTADGTPLKVSLQRSMRRSKLRAIGLVLPPLLFLLGLFIIPIGNLLTRSTDDTLINYQLPLTFAMIDQWDREQLPEESLFEAMYLDLSSLNKYLISDNFADTVDPDDPAWRVRIPPKGPYRDAMITID
ncbi:MAG TPA: hypothetical protein QF882_06370, partial [Arenicellales bacterium]|nr:hypothetical protein [Arenicellales bacterium]